jgi:hypothetical protein
MERHLAWVLYEGAWWRAVVGPRAGAPRPPDGWSMAIFCCDDTWLHVNENDAATVVHRRDELPAAAVMGDTADTADAAHRNDAAAQLRCPRCAAPFSSTAAVDAHFACCTGVAGYGHRDERRGTDATHRMRGAAALLSIAAMGLKAHRGAPVQRLAEDVVAMSGARDIDDVPDADVVEFLAAIPFSVSTLTYRGCTRRAVLPATLRRCSVGFTTLPIAAAALTRCAELRSLSLAMGQGVPWEALPAAAFLRRREQFRRDALELEVAVRHATALRHLTLTVPSFDNVNVQAVLALFEAKQSIRSVHCRSGFSVPAAVLDSLAGFPALTRLRISARADFTSLGRLIATAPMLTTLALQDMFIRQGDLRALTDGVLARAPQLRVLDVLDLSESKLSWWHDNATFPVVGLCDFIAACRMRQTKLLLSTETVYVACWAARDMFDRWAARDVFDRLQGELLDGCVRHPPRNYIEGLVKDARPRQQQAIKIDALVDDAPQPGPTTGSPAHGALAAPLGAPRKRERGAPVDDAPQPGPTTGNAAHEALAATGDAPRAAAPAPLLLDDVD